MTFKELDIGDHFVTWMTNMQGDLYMYKKVSDNYGSLVAYIETSKEIADLDIPCMLNWDDVVYKVIV